VTVYPAIKIVMRGTGKEDKAAIYGDSALNCTSQRQIKCTVTVITRLLVRPLTLVRVSCTVTVIRNTGSTGCIRTLARAFCRLYLRPFVRLSQALGEKVCIRNIGSKSTKDARLELEMTD
jgi:hypothetical protein